MKENNERYARQMVLENWGIESQNQLAQSKVLIIGLGALGSPSSLYLAAAGVGQIGLVEFDSVDTSNLHRQILYENKDVGRPKVDLAEARLKALRPDLTIEKFPRGIAVSEMVEVFSGYDLILDGTDNFPSRYLHNDAAFFAKRPLVSGSILRWEGQVTVYHPAAGSPCLRCLFPTPPALGAVPNCAEAGVVGALCGIVGSWQALESIKILIGQGESLTGKLWVFNGLDGRWRKLNLKKDPDCPLCGNHPTMTELEVFPGSLLACHQPPENLLNMENMEDAGTIPDEVDCVTANEWLRSYPQDYFLLDVREQSEWDLSQLSGAVLIPMGEITSRVNELPKDKHIIVHCHHGIRSDAVCQYLRGVGFARVTNLGGGIDAWSREVDSAVPRY